MSPKSRFCRACWRGKSASDGHDFPAKVWPMAFSKCRRARKTHKTAPGGQHFGSPTGALQNVNYTVYSARDLKSFCNVSGEPDENRRTLAGSSPQEDRRPASGGVPQEGSRPSSCITSARWRATAGAGSMTATPGPAIFFITSERNG